MTSPSDRRMTVFIVPLDATLEVPPEDMKDLCDTATHFGCVVGWIYLGAPNGLWPDFEPRPVAFRFGCIPIGVG